MTVISRLRSGARRPRRGKAMTEYILVTILIMMCSIGMYFTALITGSSALGQSVCSECPDHNSGGDVSYETGLDGLTEELENAGENSDGANPDSGNNGIDEELAALPPADNYNEGFHFNFDFESEYWGYIWDSWFDFFDFDFA